ncbi:hypothetical protein [Hymenobacter properus]|uniref:Uncharacterized protein n=1 Tax=Hymenobacter properus TaxID=2791026 RepID=A0A931BL36_9BACT|nr:hypothetical protein [Hymenobacter properus]MBF9144287.1 hypothetical protein [Hymenobacter properus]MBR7723105.1 hypothetical protein [Microvirga sp. SRT04]
MNTQPQARPSATLASGSQSAAGTPEEQQARAQAKLAKKERKHARLRFFFGWCEGCQAFGSAF